MSIVDLLHTHPALIVAAAFAFGLAIGSFLNVVIYRLPVMLERDWRCQCAELLGQEPPAFEGKFNLATPRSACPACKAPIRAWQNIPVLSWLALKGRCAACGARIPLRYPAIELLTGLMFAAVAWRFGLSWETAAALLLTASLIALSFIDIDHQILPDNITLPLLWLGLALALAHPQPGAETLFIAPATAITGAIAGYMSLWLVYWIFKLVTGKEGMGYGDFKLLGALGAWLGWQMLPLVIVLSALVGAVIGIAMILLAGRDRSVPIPFGPYLAAAGWIALIWGQDIVAVYLDTLVAGG